MASFNIREATEQDCEEIHRMIKELAADLHEADSVKISVDDLKRDGFGEKPEFHVFVAEQSSQGTAEEKHPIIGYLLYYYGYSSWSGKVGTVEDFYMCPEWRGKGIGSALLATFLQRALSVGCNYATWVAVTDNMRSMDFYKRIGASINPEKEDVFFLRMDKNNMGKFVAKTLEC